MPMTNRLQKTLDSAAFGYTEEDLEKDIKSKFVDSGKKAISGISGLFTKKQPHETSRDNDVFETLKRLSELKDNGIITEEEFSNKKAELLTKL